MLFERDPDVIETIKCGLVQTTCLTSHSQQFPAEVDGGPLGLIAILLPVRVDDSFDKIGLKKRG